MGLEKIPMTLNKAYRLTAMKTKSLFALAISAIAVLAAGCAQEERLDSGSVCGDGVWAVFQQPGACVTKAYTDNGTGKLTFAWSDKEAISVFSDTDGEQMTYAIKEYEGVSGKFNVRNFTLKEGDTYYAAYPALGYEYDCETASVSFLGQKQEGSGTGHLAKYAWSAASATAESNSATFNFATQVSWLIPAMTFTEAYKVKSVTVKMDREVIPTSATFNVKTGVLTAGDLSDEITLSLGDGADVAAGGTLKAYITVMPFTPTENYQIIVKCDKDGTETTLTRDMSGSGDALVKNTPYVISCGFGGSTAPLVDGWYQVATAEQFIWLTSNHYSWQSATNGIKIMADIDFGCASVSPVISLHGTFDGQGHTMSNFTVGKSGSGAGLFSGDNIETVTIKDVTFKNVTAIHPDATDDQGYAGVVFGGILAVNANVTLENVIVDGAEVKGVQSVAGLVGVVSGTTTLTAKNCKVLGSSISNYSMAGESGYVATLVGKYAGTVNIEGTVESKDNEVVGIYAGGTSRPESSIDEIGSAYYTGAGTLNGKSNIITDGNKVTRVPIGATVVSTADDLLALTAEDVIVCFAEDIDMTGKALSTIKYSNVDVTVVGNGHTVSGITVPLFNFFGGTVRISGLKVANSTIGANADMGCGAIVEVAQWSNLYMTDCHVTNVNITSQADVRYGLLVGALYGGGEIKGCSVSSCEVNVSAGSVGGLIGHEQRQTGYLDYLSISKCSVTGTKLHTDESGAWRVGEIIGTITGDNVSISDCTTSGNTLSQTGKTAPGHDLYGRCSGGSLTVEGSFVAGKVSDGLTYEDGTYFASADAGIEAAMDINVENLSVKLSADVTVNVEAWQTAAFGGDKTKEIVIDLGGKTLTFNNTNSDWDNVSIANEATLVIKNGKITNTGYNDGPWNRHDINFACKVKLEDVTSDKAIALAADSDLKNVTIEDKNNTDTYALWIKTLGQTVNMSDCKILMTDCVNGRGIKIANQYISTDDEKAVTLNVSGTTFKTLKKAAVLVTSTKGATISWSANDISEVAADQANGVWVDADCADYADLVAVTGGSKIVEP